MTCEFDAMTWFHCPKCNSTNTTEYTWDVLYERLFQNPKKAYLCCECHSEIEGSHYAGRFIAEWICEGCEEAHGHKNQKYEVYLHQCNFCRMVAREANQRLFKRCAIPYNALEYCLSSLDQQDSKKLNEDEHWLWEQWKYILDKKCDSMAHIPWYFYCYADVTDDSGIEVRNHQGKVLETAEENGIQANGAQIHSA